MWTEKLDKVNKIISDYGTTPSLGIELSLDSDEVKQVFEIFGYSLPQEYLRFLRRVNGFDFNGCSILGIGNSNDTQLDLVDNNTLFRKNGFDYFLYGTSSLYWYVDKGDYIFCQMDEAGDVIIEYASFDDMVEAILDESLDF